MSADFFKISKGVTLTPQAAEPTGENGDIYYNSTLFKFRRFENGVWKDLGSGAGIGINYITNPDAEANTQDWITYADAAGTSPVDGTGGSPTITWTRSTSLPLRGLGSFLYTKDAANRQGNGASIPFTIDRADQGKMLRGYFDFSVLSGTFADNDVSIWVYDITNAILIPTTPFQLKNHSLPSERFPIEFQTSINSTSYRFIIHQASTSALAYVLKFDNFVVGPQEKVYGSAELDWNTTSQGPSSAITNGTRDGYAWKKEGDTVAIQLAVTFTGAGSLLGFTPAQILPAGLSLDTSKIMADAAGGNDDKASVGTYTATDAGVAFYQGIVTYNKTTNVFDLTVATSGAAPFTPGSTDGFQITIRVPILGWSSSTILSNDAETRVFAFQAAGGNPASASSGNPIIFPTVLYDTHGGYNASTGRYTVLTPGFYKIHGVLSTPNNGVGINAYKNGVSYSNIGFTDSNGECSYTGTVLCNAGDLIDIRPGAVLDADASSTLLIEKISGPAQIAASEKVYAKYQTTTAGSYPTASTTIVNFDTKIDDSHGAVTTGASWKFTAPKSGRARVKAQVQVAAMAGWVAGEFVNLQLFRNNVFIQYLTLNIQTASHSTDIFAAGSDEIQLVAGDFLHVGLGQNNGATAALISAQPGTNLISISMD